MENHEKENEPIETQLRTHESVRNIKQENLPIEMKNNTIQTD